jgi:tetratricopeptide (TPR) repeat protein
MIYLKRWSEAVEPLELLVESDPESTRYLNSLGKVMWEMGQYERAANLFKRTYDKNPSDQTALAGMVEALIKLDRRSEALPYLEELSRQEPTNRGVRRYLALQLYDAGDYEKARSHLTILSRNEDVELGVLEKTARTYDHLGLAQQAAKYWERVLGRDPKNSEAHMFLAGYYEEMDQPDRAITHVLAVLNLNPDDTGLYSQLGQLYEMAGEYDKALVNYNKYLEQHPEAQGVEQQVAALQNAMVHEAPVRAADREFNPVNEQGQTANLMARIAKLEASGRYQDVIPLYRKLLALSPENHEIIADLARELIVVKQRQDQDSMIKFLEAIGAGNPAIYRAVAESLRQQGGEDELLAVLHEIHRVDPGDTFAIQELAVLYLKRDELSLSREYFTELAESGCSDNSCLEARIFLAGELHLPAQKLQAYEALLKQQPGRDDIINETIALAAQMGLLDTAVFYAGYLQTPLPDNDNLSGKMFLADAYRESGYQNRAVERYRFIIERTSGRKEAAIQPLRLHCWLGIAESYEELGLMYEAEQTLREALVREEYRTAILEKLFHLYLRTGRVTESEIWLQEVDFGPAAEARHNSSIPAEPGWKEQFFQAEKENAAGDHRLAAAHYRHAETMMMQHDNSRGVEDKGDTAASLYRIRTGLATSLLHAGEYEEAEQAVLELQNGHESKLELMVLLEQIYLAWGKYNKADQTGAEADQYAALDFGRQLHLAELYRKFGDGARQSIAAEKASVREPDSLTAKLLLVDARMKQGKYFASLELLNQFMRSYPENIWFLSQKASLLANVGSFSEALDVADMILAENPDRRDIVLLKARILWEMKRWKDSAAQYAAMVEPPVEEILEQEIRQLQLTVDQSPTKSSWWETITFSEGTPLTITQVLMPPQQAVDFSKTGQIINKIASPHYALYRWQDRFGKELSVRRSVMRQEYYHAANKLENVINEFGSNDFLLYDLAGLYSKLDRLGDEAAIYREIAQQDPEFPGLSEAVQRNNLKRRPRIFVAYNMLYDNGWDGHKAVRQEIVKGGGKYYQTINQLWNLDIARINYESTEDGQNLLGWRTMLAYDAKFSQALSLSLAGGIEKLESGYDDTPLWYGAVTGKIADEMRAVFSAKQDVVADTLAALMQNIKRRDYKIELLFDLFPRVLLGGYYDFIYYSDSNWANNYTFWASYIFMPEPTLLKISYNYDFYDSHEGNIAGIPGEDGFAPGDPPYWSPTNYWITRFSFYFKHQLSNDALARGVPSYYTIEYSLGYDAEDNDLHELKGSLNFEIAKNYILTASYGFLNQDVYEHKEALLSVTYRF